MIYYLDDPDLPRFSRFTPLSGSPHAIAISEAAAEALLAGLNAGLDVEVIDGEPTLVEPAAPEAQPPSLTDLISYAASRRFEIETGGIVIGGATSGTFSTRLYNSSGSRRIGQRNSTNNYYVDSAFTYNVTALFMTGWNADDGKVSMQRDSTLFPQQTTAETVAAGSQTVIGGIDTSITGGFSSGSYMGDVLIFNRDLFRAANAAYRTTLISLLNTRAPIGL